MKQKMTWQKIKTRYPDQWVSLIKVDTDDNNEVRAGIVVSAAPDLKALTQQLKSDNCLSDRLAYTGPIKNFLGFSKWNISDVQIGWA